MRKKKYNVIYIDPPWPQKAGRNLSGGYRKENGKQVFNPNGNTSQDLPYPTMSIADIKALPIGNVADNNAHLYMWVTNKYLPDSFSIISAWGFSYSTTIVWCKKQIGGGLGGTFRVATEFLIFATKGNLKSTKTHRHNWIEAKRKYINGYPCHSKKPDIFRNIISETSPGEKIEMFAREKHPQWDVWGNEVESDIDINEYITHP